MSKHLRKQNFVDSTVQGALLRRIVMHWVMYFIVAGIAIVLLQAMLGGPDGKPMLERVISEIREFTTVRFSNRFVGPVGRLRRYLRQLGADGNTERLSFRGGDFWSEMAEEFNVVAAKIEEQEVEIERLKTALKNSGNTARAKSK